MHLGGEARLIITRSLVVLPAMPHLLVGPFGGFCALSDLVLMPLDIASFLRFEIGRLVRKASEPLCFPASMVLLRLVLRMFSTF